MHTSILRKMSIWFPFFVMFLVLCQPASSSPILPATSPSTYDDVSETKLASTSEDPTVRIERIGLSIIKASDKPTSNIQFRIMESSKINAYSTSGGKVVVTTALLDEIKSDDELASIIGHEVAHQNRNHIKKSFFELASTGLIALFATSRQSMKARAGAGLIWLVFGRQRLVSRELQADRLGVAYAANAGYDACAVVPFLYRVQGGLENRNIIQKLSVTLTHPGIAKRLENIQESVSPCRLHGAGGETAVSSKQ